MEVRPHYAKTALRRKRCAKTGTVCTAIRQPKVPVRMRQGLESATRSGHARKQLLRLIYYVHASAYYYYGPLLLRLLTLLDHGATHRTACHVSTATTHDHAVKERPLNKGVAN
jgi:hypothetical protein